MKLFNIFFVIILCAITAFCSVFYLGSYERHRQLIDQLPFSFIYRVTGVSTIGLVGLSILIGFNFLFDKVFFKKTTNVFLLKKLAYTGSLWIVSVAFLGCILFFFG